MNITNTIAKISNMDKNELINFNNNADKSGLTEIERKILNKSIDLQFAVLTEITSRESALAIMSDLSYGDKNDLL